MTADQGRGYPTGGHKVLVCGGPEFADRERVFAAMDAADARRRIDTLLEGSDAIAVQLAGLWAVSGDSRRRCEACGRYWQMRDKSTGLLVPRTLEQAGAVAVIAFPDEDGSGGSSGRWTLGWRSGGLTADAEREP